jgi:hypothetical protein
MLRRHKTEKGQDASEDALAAWQSERSSLLELLDVAQGQATVESEGVILKKGEVALGVVTDVSLIETRSVGGHWEGHSSGLSLPIGGGIRYRVGQTRGHYMAATPHPQEVDQGTAVITNQRVVYLGESKTLECAFSKLLGLRQDGDDFSISVSNRQKPTTLHLGAELVPWFTDRLALALAMFNNDLDSFLSSIREQLGELDAAQPEEPHFQLPPS